MPTKVVKTAKKIVTEPVKTIKAGVKAVAKPATNSGVGEIAIGAALGLPAGLLYAKGWDKLSEVLPESWKTNPIVIKIIKIALPLVPIYFVKRFKVPFGTLINGLLFGIFFTQIGVEIYNAVKGGIPKKSNEIAGDEITLAKVDYV